MAGTIVIDTIKTSNTSPPVFQNTSGTEVGQLCRAWVNFNGVTTATIRSSFNVSSVTRNAAGDYTVNFTNAMTDANYSFVASGANPAVSNTVVVAPYAANPTTTAFRFGTTSVAGAFTDAAFAAAAIFR